jgi:hypothetical protein
MGIRNQEVMKSEYADKTEKTGPSLKEGRFDENMAGGYCAINVPGDFSLKTLHKPITWSIIGISWLPPSIRIKPVSFARRWFF